MNLGQGVYEEAYKKMFIKEYLKIVKKELGIDMSDEEIRTELIEMVQKQPRCGVHSKKEAEVVVDDILINRMDEIREVLARIDQRKECQE